MIKFAERVSGSHIRAVGGQQRGHRDVTNLTIGLTENRTVKVRRFKGSTARYLGLENPELGLSHNEISIWKQDAAAKPPPPERLRYAH